MNHQEQDSLEQRTKAFITDLLIGVNSEDSIDNIIQYILKELGSFMHADRICIYESGVEQNMVKETYHWKGEQLDVQDPVNRYVHSDAGELKQWISNLKRNQMILVKDLDEMQASMPLERVNMEKIGVHSLMLIPLSIKDSLPECMGIMNPDVSAFSHNEDIWLFLGKQIGSLYHRERMNHKYLYFMEEIRSSNLSEFVVDCSTKKYEAFRVTKRLKSVIPEYGDWDWLRSLYASIIKEQYREDLLYRTDISYLQSFLCANQGTLSIDIERVDAQGEQFWFRLEFSAVSVNEKGIMERFVLLVKDVTQQKIEEEKHLHTVNALSSIYSSVYSIRLSDGAVEAIKGSRPILENLSADEMFHHKVVESVCQNVILDTYEKEFREFMNLETLEARLENTNLISAEFQGKFIEWVRMLLIPSERNDDGSLANVVLAILDITIEKKQEQQMQYKIEHDELTGTLNRSAFNRVTRFMDEGTPDFALVLLDIDRFKNINDTYGHAVGDDVLEALVSVLNEKMRSIDYIFRLGGDEFAVIMNRVSREKAAAIKNIVNEVNTVILNGIEGLPAFSVSAGVAFSTTGYDEKLYHDADKALYRTKETTRKGCTIYEEMDH
ncbi:MAG: diguanylate cyclase domain-containing protein [Lachnospiraceae bacterium]